MASLATTDSTAQRISAEAQKSRGSTPSSGRRHQEEHRHSRNKAAQFFREAETTRRQIEKLEKERTVTVLCRRNGWADVKEALEDYEKALEEDRNSEKLLLQKQLMKIKTEVKRFRTQLTDVNENPKMLDCLKESMSEAEQSIHGLKEKQCTWFEELLKDEWTYGQEVNAYDKKIETWRLVVNSDVKQLSSPHFKETKSLNRGLPAGVKTLESFLQKTGGACGGWEKFDHEAFLKVWRKHGGQPAYRKEAQLLLPCKTLKEIEEHEAWHQEHVKLQDQKRAAIQQWKVNKETKHLSKVQNHKEARKIDREAQSSSHRATEERKLTTQRMKERKEAKETMEEKIDELRDAEQKEKICSVKEERQRQLEVKLMIEEQKRLMRENNLTWLEERRKKYSEEE
ncbi:coiled-coil domain-containing protein 112 [Synchiropus picturatus]